MNRDSERTKPITPPNSFPSGEGAAAAPGRYKSKKARHSVTPKVLSMTLAGRLGSGDAP